MQWMLYKESVHIYNISDTKKYFNEASLRKYFEMIVDDAA